MPSDRFATVILLFLVSPKKLIIDHSDQIIEYEIKTSIT